MTDHDFIAAMQAGLPPITPPEQLPATPLEKPAMSNLKAFYVDDMPTTYAAESAEHAKALYEEDLGDVIEDGYPQQVGEVELDRPIPDFDEDERPTGEMTTMRTWLAAAKPGFLCGAE